MKKQVLAILLLFPAASPRAFAPDLALRDALTPYNVIWDWPSKDSSGSMPIGNGDIGLNVWVEDSGDLVFYISKTDAWSENGRLLKLGRIRIRCLAGPAKNKPSFRQTLNLGQGEIEIILGTGGQQITLRVWVDACQPVIRVEAEGKNFFNLQACLEIWRTKARQLKAAEANSARGLTRNDKNDYPIIVHPDTILPAKDNRIIWLHRNEKSCYPITLINQHLKDLLAKYPDPLLHRTFGGCMKGRNLKAIDDRTLKSIEPGKRFVVSIYPLTAQTKSIEEWLNLLAEQIASIDKIELGTARQAHRQWWNDFWQRSWVRVSGESKGQEISTNSLPLRIGADSNGSNRFKGFIDRVRIFNRPLCTNEIAHLARTAEANVTAGLVGDWTFDVTDKNCFPNKLQDELVAKIIGSVETTRYQGREGVRLSGEGYLEVGHHRKLNLTDVCTLEAWIAPDKLSGGGGRIIDKSKAGTANGYLLDTYPGNSLRIITEAKALSFDAKLPPGQWTHVAATYHAGHGESKLYINGSLVAALKTGLNAFMVSRGYTLQRWVNACGGRGNYPIKFNGSIFTVDAQVRGEHFDADYRRWGGMYWWQNTRLPYWSMLASGDFDLMQPLFKMYMEALPLCKDKTKKYYHHEGAFFPETMYFWGTNGNCDYGWGNPGPETVNQYIRREWQGGIELTAMMLDYYAITQERKFLHKTLIPLAEQVITFFDRHWARDQNGKIRFAPAQALETWWQCVNPLPEVAGLRYVIERLLELPETAINAQQRTAWQKTLNALPPIPLKGGNGARFLLPAEEFKVLKNSEVPELYAVFPYRWYGQAQGSIEIALETWRRRRFKGTGGWRQDSIWAAYLGLAQQAAEYVSQNFSRWHNGSRFPGFWGPNYDWVPDQDHGCVAMAALQRMLLQTDGQKIVLLPAWPKYWDADFKLHAPYQTIVQGKVRHGKLIKLRVRPAERKRDVIVMEAR